MRPITSASQACGSTSLSLAVPTRVYMAAAGSVTPGRHARPAAGPQGAKPEAEGVHDADHGCETGIAVGGKRLVQAFLAQPRFRRDGGHPPGSGDVSERRRDDARIAVLERRFQVSHDVVEVPEMVRRIPGAGLRPCRIGAGSRLLHRSSPFTSSCARSRAHSMSWRRVALSPPAGRTSPGWTSLFSDSRARRFGPQESRPGRGRVSPGPFGARFGGPPVRSAGAVRRCEAS